MRRTLLGTTSRSVSPDWVQRYLDLLQVERAAPSLSALTRLTDAHVRRVPFENITSVLHRQAHGDGPVPALDPEATLQAWQAGRGGGVCFKIVDMFDRLLAGLGYRTHPVLGRITFPGSHQANLVELDARRYLLDVGNGSPFFEPIPLDAVIEVRQAGLAWRFRPDPDSDGWIQDRRLDDAWVPFCTYDLAPPDPAARAAAYQHHHLPGQSWVVDNLVLTRSLHDEVWVLRDDELRHFSLEGKTVERIQTAADYPRLVAEVFGLPDLPIASAVAALAELRREREAAGPPSRSRQDR